jgi:uncharacterized RmlC-like cupin family protein
MTDRCVLVPAGDAKQGQNRLTYAAGVSAETAGASKLSLQIASLPPGARAQANLHAEHESAYIVEGEVLFWFGQRLEERIEAGPRDFIYIPPGVPHFVNPSDRQPAVTILARTDPNEQEDVTPLPELDDLPHLRE